MITCSLSTSDCTNKEQMMALVSELKILIHIGHHLNIVNLLGAVTKDLRYGECTCSSVSPGKNLETTALFFVTSGWEEESRFDRRGPEKDKEVDIDMSCKHTHTSAHARTHTDREGGNI